MLKHFKNTKPFIVISRLVFIQMFSISAQAVGTCLCDKSDISEDTKKISEQLKRHYGHSHIENPNTYVYESGAAAYVNSIKMNDKMYSSLSADEQKK